MGSDWSRDNGYIGRQGVGNGNIREIRRCIIIINYDGHNAGLPNPYRVWSKCFAQGRRLNRRDLQGSAGWVGISNMYKRWAIHSIGCQFTGEDGIDQVSRCDGRNINRYSTLSWCGPNLDWNSTSIQPEHRSAGNQWVSGQWVVGIIRYCSTAGIGYVYWIRNRYAGREEIMVMGSGQREGIRIKDGHAEDRCSPGHDRYWRKAFVHLSGEVKSMHHRHRSIDHG